MIDSSWSSVLAAKGRALAESQRKLAILSVFKMNSIEKPGLLNLVELRTALEELELTCNDDEFDLKAAEELMKSGGTLHQAEEEEEEGDGVQRIAFLEFDILIQGLFDHLDTAGQVAFGLGALSSSRETLLEDTWRQIYPGVSHAQDKNSMIDQFIASSELAQDEGADNAAMLAAQAAAIAQKEKEKKMNEETLAETARMQKQYEEDARRLQEEAARDKAEMERLQKEESEEYRKAIQILRDQCAKKDNECKLKEKAAQELEEVKSEIEKQNKGLRDEIGVMKQDHTVTRLQLQRQAERVSTLKRSIGQFGADDDYEGCVMLVLPNMDMALKFQEANLNKKKAKKVLAQCETDAHDAIKKFLNMNQERPLFPEDEDAEDLIMNLWVTKQTNPDGEIEYEISETTLNNICKRLVKYLEKKFECKKHLDDNIFAGLAEQTVMIERAEVTASEEKITGVDSGDSAGSNAGVGKGSGSGVDWASRSHPGAGKGSGMMSMAGSFIAFATGPATPLDPATSVEGSNSGSTKLSAKALEWIHKATNSNPSPNFNPGPNSNSRMHPQGH